MQKGKMYKKFLSCALAAAMVVTSGVFYPGNGKTAAAAGIEFSFQDKNEDWYIIDGGDGVLLDSQGVRYQLNKDGITATVCGFGYNGSGGPTQSDTVKISDTVPISYTDYTKYNNNGKDTSSLGATNRTPSKVTAIEANAFSGSSTLKEVTVPESVTTIGDKAFAFCPELTKLDWQVTDAQNAQIGDNAGNWNETEILEGSPKCILSSRVEVSPSPAASETPGQEPTAVPGTTPGNTPSTVPSGEPSPVPSNAPTAVPVPVPATATPATATPEAPTPAVTTSASPTATPTVPWRPVVPPSTTPVEPTPTVTAPVVQTPAPGETLAPTVAPTEVVITPAPASEKPAITEVPAITEAPTVTAVPEKPAETTSPVQPTVAPVVVKNNVSYEVNKSTKSVSVSNMGDVKTSTVTIPSTVKIDGVSYKVTSVDKNAFKNNTKIKTVQLGKNITKIEAGAFQGCKKLTSVKLPSKLMTISKNSFNGCSSLKTVSMPKTVTKIGKAAFKNCTSLKKVSIGNAPKKNLGGLSFEESQIRYGASTVTINIGAKAFENCKKLNKVIINALVKIIGKSAFKDCKSLRSVLIYSEVLKKVKGGALTGVNNCKISVPAKKVAPYKILFKNKGQGKKVVVAKL